MINHILGILFNAPVSSTRAAQTFTESESKKQSYIKAIQASYNWTIENNTSFQRRHPGQIQIRVVYQDKSRKPVQAAGDRVNDHIGKWPMTYTIQMRHHLSVWMEKQQIHLGTQEEGARWTNKIPKVSGQQIFGALAEVDLKAWQYEHFLLAVQHQPDCISAWFFAELLWKPI